MISFVIPVYNEERILEKSCIALHGHLYKQGYDFEVIYCDDGSCDGTGGILSKLREEYPTVSYCSYHPNQGRGHAIKQCLNTIQGDKVIFMDADVPIEVNLSVLESIIDGLNHYDLAKPSRFMSDSFVKRKLLRGALANAYRVVFSMLYPQSYITDTQVGIKGFRRDIFEELNHAVSGKGWDWDIQIMLEAMKRGHTIKEVAVEWVESSDSSVKICRDSWRILCALIRFKFSY
ncbi:MAG: glycosyltransferase [Nanobdellota archaeon]